VKGALRLLLLLGFAAIGLFFLGRMPRDVTLVYDLEEPEAVRAVEVDVRRGVEPLRHAEYRFPVGAPRQVRHEVRLPDGTYEVVLRVSRVDGSARQSLVPLVVSEGGPIVLSIRRNGANAD